MGTATPLMIKDITQVLEAPDAIAGIDKASIAKLNEEYPYFTAGRYLQAARRHATQPFSVDMMTGMQLYMGNWFMFHKFLTQAGKARVLDSYYSTSTVEVDSNGQAADMFTASVQNKAAGAAETEDNAHTGNDEETGQYITDKDQDNEAKYGGVSNSHVATGTAETEQQVGADKEIVEPLYSSDYFRSEGVAISNEIPDNLRPSPATAYFDDDNVDREKALIVVRGFSEWLSHLKHKQEYEQSEEEDKKALKAMWQREKLAAAIEEEDDDIPEEVFEMAVNSINKENDLNSESLADILTKQGKYDEAIEMYSKLSLRNPQKNTYFADKIEAILKRKGS